MRFPSSFVSISARFQELGNPFSAWPLLYTGLPVPVSAARSWRFSQVPRLPLCVHAPLEDSGGVLAACHNATRTHAFQRVKTVGFPHPRMSYLYYPYRPQPQHFRSSVTRPTHLLHLASHTPYWICTQVRYRQGGESHLAGLGRSFALTCWVTISPFTASFPIPGI